MEPTPAGRAIADLNRLVRGKAADTDVPIRRSRWDHIHWYRKAAIELSIIMAVFISVALYLFAVIAFVRWAL